MFFVVAWCLLSLKFLFEVIVHPFLIILASFSRSHFHLLVVILCVFVVLIVHLMASNLHLFEVIVQLVAVASCLSLIIISLLWLICGDFVSFCGHCASNGGFVCFFVVILHLYVVALCPL